jgi:hypothetical protein
MSLFQGILQSEYNAHLAIIKRFIIDCLNFSKDRKFVVQKL